MSKPRRYLTPVAPHVDALRPPPHSLEAEQSILGAILLDNSSIAAIDHELQPDDFYSAAHRLIYEHAIRLYAKPSPIDVITLAESLRAEDKLDYIGGHGYLGGLLQAVPTATRAAGYARIVREHAARREIMAAAMDLGDAAASPLAPGSSELILAAQTKLEAIARDSSDGPVPIDLAAMAVGPVPERLMRVGQIMPKGQPGLLTGHGGAGKTQTALHLAICLALDQQFFGESVLGATVAFISTEDDQTDLHYRLAQQVATLGATIDDLVGRMFLYDFTATDPVLITATSQGEIVTTARYAALRADLRRRGVEVAFLDNFATLCAVDLIRPAHATQAVALCGQLVPPDGNAILLAHVDKATARAGYSTEGYSGTAAFHNRARWRWFLFAPNRGDDTTDDDEPPEADPRRILEVQKINAGRAGTRIALRILDNGAIATDGDVGGIVASISRRKEQRDVLASLTEAEARGIPVPTAETNRNTAYEALETMPSYPEGLRGKSGKRRLFRVLRQMRADGDVGVCEFTGSGRHKREGYCVARIEK